MMHYWHNLQQRDQRVVMIGAVVAVPLLIFVLIIDPFSREVERLQQAVDANSELLAWMEESARQVKRLQGSGAARRNGGGSLLSLVDSSAKQNGLGGALKQVKPEGDGVRLRFEQAAFDDMVRWLGRLGSEQGVGVSSLTMERLPASGQVNATVVLEKGA
ncbi:MAG: type II secretion system protein M [Chromatiales bacterium]|nr:type II secretion system protein M [Chromatiales bacterium]